jgi:hypothetical protein
LTANGATSLPGFFVLKAASADVIFASQSSSASLGRALRAGNDPTTPLMHCATTSSGLDTMNIGAPITGSDRPRRISSIGM